MITEIINPPIAWRFFIVYWRLPDGRMKYFRGSRRRDLFIRNVTTDWVSDQDAARLFELREPAIQSDRSFSKNMRGSQIRNQLHFRGFEGPILRSHVIIPAKVKHS